MNGRPEIAFKRFLVPIIAVLAFGLIAASGASASLAVGPGSTFSTSYIDLPEGALPGGDSGSFNGSIDPSSLSSTGRYLAFSSNINSMSADADPDYTNVFRKDRQTGAVELVSRATGANGAGPADHSYGSRISGDGNLVAFLTASALDPADIDDKLDVYVRDLTAKSTTLATPGTTEDVYRFDLSANGLYVVFNVPQDLLPADTNGIDDVYRRNLSSGVVDLVSRKAGSPNPGIRGSVSPSISGDGRWVAFASDEQLLVAGFVNHNGGSADVFARDMSTSTNYLISRKAAAPNNGGNAESGDPVIAGTPAAPATVKVAYRSYATDVAAGDVAPASSIYLGVIASDSILISRVTGVAGANADSRAHGPSISDDGKLVFFSTDATNLDPNPNYYGAYVRNLNDNTTTLRSNDNDYAISADISGDGSRLAWVEDGGFTPDSDLGARGVFTRATGGGTAEFTSRPPGSAPMLLPGSAYIYPPESGTRTISADGRYVTFNATSNRLPGDSLDPQAYRRDLSTGEIELASRATGAGGVPAGFAQEVSISADGSRIAFASFSSLVPEDVDITSDIYVRDFSNDTTTLASRADGPFGAPANDEVEESMISSDGNWVVFSTKATNLDVAGGNQQVYVRNLTSNQTVLVSRKSSDPVVAGSNDSGKARISGDGRMVVFESRSTNLDPADGGLNRDIYVRDQADSSTTLVSRLGGLAGAATPGSKFAPAISSDGKVVAFETDEEPIAPEAGAWPMFGGQVVSRVIATGANTLVSRAPGGAAAGDGASEPTVDADGSVIAFESSSSNLIPGLGGGYHRAVFARQSASGVLSGPPAFGEPDNDQGASAPSISDNGQCLAFNATGFNEASGSQSDLQGAYVNVISGTCTDPRQDERTSKPKLSRVKLTKKRFTVARKQTAKVAGKHKKKRKRKSPKGTRIKFKVSENSSVTIKIERKVAGRKVKGKCRKVTRKNAKRKKCRRFVKSGKLKRRGLKAGAQKVYFSGRLGKRKLKPGKYRVQLIAYNSAGASNRVFRPFRIVRR